MVAASAVLPEADCLQGWYGSVNLLNATGGKTSMCCKIALDSDLPFPRSAFLTFPFEAYLDSPGRT